MGWGFEGRTYLDCGVRTHGPPIAENRVAINEEKPDLVELVGLMIVLCHDMNEVGVCIVANKLLKKWGCVSHVGSAEALGGFFLKGN